jgi:hypothetical protein
LEDHIYLQPYIEYIEEHITDKGFNFVGYIPKTLRIYYTDLLPLEVRRIILSKIWDNGWQYNALGVDKGDLFLPLRLHYPRNFEELDLKSNNKSSFF